MCGCKRVAAVLVLMLGATACPRWVEPTPDGGQDEPTPDGGADGPGPDGGVDEPPPDAGVEPPGADLYGDGVNPQSVAGWHFTPRHALGGGGGINTVAALGSTILAGGDVSGLKRSTDSATTWTNVNAGLGEHIRIASVAFKDATTAW